MMNLSGHLPVGGFFHFVCLKNGFGGLRAKTMSGCEKSGVGPITNYHVGAFALCNFAHYLKIASVAASLGEFDLAGGDLGIGIPGRATRPRAPPRSSGSPASPSDRSAVPAITSQRRRPAAEFITS